MAETICSVYKFNKDVEVEDMVKTKDLDFLQNLTSPYFSGTTDLTHLGILRLTNFFLTNKMEEGHYVIVITGERGVEFFDVKIGPNNLISMSSKPVTIECSSKKEIKTENLPAESETKIEDDDLKTEVSIVENNVTDKIPMEFIAPDKSEDSNYVDYKLYGLGKSDKIACYLFNQDLVFIKDLKSGTKYLDGHALRTLEKKSAPYGIYLVCKFVNGQYEKVESVIDWAATLKDCRTYDPSMHYSVMGDIHFHPKTRKDKLEFCKKFLTKRPIDGIDPKEIDDDNLDDVIDRINLPFSPRNPDEVILKPTD